MGWDGMRSGCRACPQLDMRDEVNDSYAVFLCESCVHASNQTI